MRRIVVNALDVALDLGVAVASSFGHAHHRGGTARLVFPIHERLHGFHVLVSADDQHFAVVLKKSVLGSAFSIVDETVAVGGIHLGRHLAVGFAGNLLVHAVVAHLLHGNGHAVVDAQGLRHGVVCEGAYHDVLATEVADNVRRFQIGLDSRIESVLVIHASVGVRHRGRVDLTAEVAFGGCNLDVLVVGVGTLDDADVHLGPVANDGGNRELREVGRASLEHGGHLRHGNDILAAVLGVHIRQVETTKSEFNDDFLLAARNQLDLGSRRVVLVDVCPLLGKSHG